MIRFVENKVKSAARLCQGWTDDINGIDGQEGSP